MFPLEGPRTNRLMSESPNFSDGAARDYIQDDDEVDGDYRDDDMTIMVRKDMSYGFSPQ
jgi:hypothetical protein